MHILCSFSPDSRWLATLQWNQIKVWEAASGRELARLNSLNPKLRIPEQVRKAALSPDGTLLATSGYEKVRVWDWAQKRELVSLDHEGAIEVLHFSPDGKWLVTTKGGKWRGGV